MAMKLLHKIDDARSWGLSFYSVVIAPSTYLLNRNTYSIIMINGYKDFNILNGKSSIILFMRGNFNI